MMSRSSFLVGTPVLDELYSWGSDVITIVVLSLPLGVVHMATSGLYKAVKLGLCSVK